VSREEVEEKGVAGGRGGGREGRGGEGRGGVLNECEVLQGVKLCWSLFSKVLYLNPKP